MDLEEKKREETEFHKRLILETARIVFAKKGYQSTTMDNISKESHYSKATIYKYFSSKKSLYSEILLQGFREINKIGKTCFKIKTKNYQKQMQTFIAKLCLFLQTHQKTLKIFVDESVFSKQKSKQDELQKLFEQKFEKNEIDNYLEKGQQDGTFKTFSIKLMKSFILSSIGGYFHSAIANNELDFNKNSKDLSDLIFDGLRRREDATKAKT